jgi:RNA polymerase sigma-70 factor, ECF subfamily
MDIGNELCEYVPPLRRYAQALVSDRDLADDLVQDTLVRALNCRAQFTKGTNLRAWLHTLMHNIFLDQTRKAAIRTRHLSRHNPDLYTAQGAMYFSLTSSLDIEDMDCALLCLPAEQRAVVLLIALDEMSYAEVATTLDIPIGTVMSRLFRGRERLRKLMEGTQRKNFAWRDPARRKSALERPATGDRYDQ